MTADHRPLTIDRRRPTADRRPASTIYPLPSIVEQTMPKPIIYATDPASLARDGLTDTVRAWEDSLRADTGRGSFEWWYFDAHFEDGSTAVIVFLTKSLLHRNRPLQPGVSLTITRPDGVKLVELPFFTPEQFTASEEICDVRIGPNWVKYRASDGPGWEYVLHVETGDLSADLIFTGLVPPWRPGAGKSCFGDLKHYFAWLPAIPHGRVTGTLTYEGQTHPVTGNGYHDHNWGNVGLNKVMDRWYWGRAHIGEYTLIFVEQIATKAYGSQRLPVFMLAQGDQILIGDGRPLRMTARDLAEHADGRRYPREVDFYWQADTGRVQLALRNPQMLEAVTLLHFPAWQRAILRLFVNPYYFRFNVDLELRVELGDLRDTVRGSALYEVMLLR
ncbi:MAG: hypothetical protein KKD28_01330 [Chloroflexi bacterium]|nr:hypothetical protein [Chloroflexota bacterium]